MTIARIGQIGRVQRPFRLRGIKKYTERSAFEWPKGRENPGLVIHIEQLVSWGRVCACQE